MVFTNVKVHSVQLWIPNYFNCNERPLHGLGSYSRKGFRNATFNASLKDRPVLITDSMPFNYKRRLPILYCQSVVMHLKYIFANTIYSATT